MSDNEATHIPSGVALEQSSDKNNKKVSTMEEQVKQNKESRITIRLSKSELELKGSVLQRFVRLCKQHNC